MHESVGLTRRFYECVLVPNIPINEFNVILDVLYARNFPSKIVIKDCYFKPLFQQAPSYMGSNEACSPSYKYIPHLNALL